MNMSFSEKSAWISFVSTIAIFGYYFFKLSELSGIDLALAKPLALALLFKAIVLIAIVEAVFHAMLAQTNIKAAKLGADERDKLIELKASKYGYTILSLGVFFTLGRLLLVEQFPQLSEHNSSLAIPFFTAHILMFAFILSEIVRFGSQIVLYRRGY